MKKILILTAFALSGLAAAQDTTTPVTPPPADTTPAVDPSAPVETTDTTDTTTETTQTTTENTAAPVVNTQSVSSDNMSAADHYARAQELAAQADVAYPAAFYDRTLWKAAVDQSYLATQGNTERAYSAYLAQLYTKTQWWINAYNAWSKLDNLSDTEKQWAAQSAAKLAYMALQRGDKVAAKTYVNQGLSWANTQSLQDIAKRL